MKTSPTLSVAFPLLLALSSCGSGPGPAPASIRAETSIPSQTTLRWEAVPGADHYKVYRIWAHWFPFMIEGTVTQPYFQDSQLENNTEYTYQVSAVVKGQESPRSKEVTVRTHPGLVEQVKASLEGTVVRVQWKPLTGVNQYRVYRETESAEAPPTSFLVAGNPVTSEFLDPAPPPGLTSYYFVVPELENVAYAYGGLSFAAVRVPGQHRIGPLLPAETPLPPLPLTLRAEEKSGGVQLHWTSQGRGATYAVSRRSPDGAVQRIEEGLLGTAYWDGHPLSGQPASYVVSVRRQGQPDRSSGPVTVTVSHSVPSPGTVDLKLRLPGQPEQQVRLYSADRNLPFRGVLIVVGQSVDQLPRLLEAAGAQKMAVLSFEAFNFGTPESPRPLSTRTERWRSILILDLRRPRLSSQYLQEALSEAAKVWPDHPEFATIPLAGWAFSQADVGLTQVLARPEWKGRVAAMIHGNALEPDVVIPLFALSGVPHLMILSGRFDPYSQLQNGMAYTTEVTREKYLRNLIQVHQLPVSILSNPGKGHGEGLDSPWAAAWLEAVFAQRSQVPLDSWQGRVGWTGGFAIETSIESPWGDGKNKGVKLAGVTVQEGVSASNNWSWFPSRQNAEAWQKLASTAP